MDFIEKILFEAIYRPRVKSSNIKKVWYDDKKHLLRLTFHSGYTYEYYDVPKRVWTAFTKAKSKGRYAYYNICWSFDYAQLD